MNFFEEFTNYRNTLFIWSTKEIPSYRFNEGFPSINPFVFLC